MKYYEQLTWLRGIAALFVVIAHSSSAILSYGVEVSFLTWMHPLGGLGVVLFFVLSGTTLYLSDINKTNSLPAFYIKRILRIWPAFFVSFIIYLIFYYIFNHYNTHGYSWLTSNFVYDYTLNDVFSYLTLTHNVFGGNRLFNGAFWTLAVEFQYYLIFPILIIAIRLFGMCGPIIVGGIIYALPFLGFTYDRYDFFILGFTFCGGVLIGYIHHRFPTQLNERFTYVILSILFVLVYVVVGKIYPTFHLELPTAITGMLSNKPAVGILGLLMVLAIINTNFTVPHKIRKFLAHYGTISYSTYLYHNLILGTLFLVIDHSWNIYVIVLLTYAITLIGSYYLAGLSYSYIEKPSLLIGRNLANKYPIKIDKNLKAFR